MKLKTRTLKIKIKSLASEATIIRSEERKLKTPFGFSTCNYADNSKDAAFARQSAIQRLAAFDHLREHRKYVVGREARISQLAYGLIRGKPFKVVECANKQTSYELAGLVPSVHTIAVRFGYIGTRDEVEEWFLHQEVSKLTTYGPKIKRIMGRIFNR